MIFLYCIGLLFLGGLTGFILCLLLDDIKQTKKMEELEKLVPYKPPKLTILKEPLKHYQFKQKLSKKMTDDWGIAHTEYVVCSNLISQMRQAIKKNLESDYNPETGNIEYIVDIWFRK